MLWEGLCNSCPECRKTLSLIHISVTLSLLLAVGSGCKDSSQSQGVGWQPNVPFGTLPPGFDSFPERWHKQIHDRLAREEAAKQKEIRELRDKFLDVYKRQAQARGTERYGLIASSGAKRLRQFGIWVQSNIQAEDGIRDSPE